MLGRLSDNFYQSLKTVLIKFCVEVNQPNQELKQHLARVKRKVALRQ